MFKWPSSFTTTTQRNDSGEDSHSSGEKKKFGSSEVN